jgi:signal transduction histidine kinase
MPDQPNPRSQPAGEQTEEVLAVVAHELRRPLTALLGAVTTLQQRGPTLSVLQQQELLGMAGRQGQQLQRLLDQLLAAAGVDRGQARLARRSLVDAAALAAEAGQAARLAHPDHPIAIKAAGPLLVRVDPLAISRILGNLLDNAATYSPPGGPIWLSASRDGPDAVLTIQDAGPGIPLADRDRVFQRYTRLGQPTGRPSGGLGLGLFIARRLAHANRGQLHLTDPPDGGARFELRLRLAPPAPGAHQPSRSVQHRASGRWSPAPTQSAVGSASEAVCRRAVKYGRLTRARSRQLFRVACTYRGA